MARIRSVKPEFWTDSKTGPLSEFAKCLFIGLLNHADDFGVLEFEPVEWIVKIFPYHPGRTLTEYSRSTHGVLMQSLVHEILPRGLVSFFSLTGEDEKETIFCFIRNFIKHQVINRPSKPLLDGWKKSDNPKTYADRQNFHFENIGTETLTEYSRSTHGVLMEYSLPEGKGREKEGKKEKETTKTTSAANEKKNRVRRKLRKVHEHRQFPPERLETSLPRS